MTHPTAAVNPKLSLKEAINAGLITKNALVSGYPGHPCPTIAALVSDGVISLNQLVGSITLAGYGGE